MILVHRLKGDRLFLNADLVESIEETPDTVVTLVDGRPHRGCRLGRRHRRPDHSVPGLDPRHGDGDARRCRRLRHCAPSGRAILTGSTDSPVRTATALQPPAGDSVEGRSTSSGVKRTSVGADRAHRRADPADAGSGDGGATREVPGRPRPPGLPGPFSGPHSTARQRPESSAATRRSRRSTPSAPCPR